MFNNWYKIKGISKEMYEVWKGELREDIVAWESGNDAHLRIKLNPISAFLLRRQMRKWNSKNVGCIQLIKLEECEA